MVFFPKPLNVIAVTTLSLNAAACSQPIEADYCVGVSNNESGAIGPEDNTFIVTVLDAVLLPLEYIKSESVGQADYEKTNPEYSNVGVTKNLGRLGTVISHFHGSKESPEQEGRAALIAVVDNEIRSRYLVRDCEDISPGSTPKLFN